MVWVGYAALVVAVVWLLVKMHMAYNSAGGTIMVTVYDAAFYPPVLVAVGLYLVLPSYQINLALWVFLVIWGVSAAIAAGAIRLMEEVGDRPL